MRVLYISEAMIPSRTANSIHVVKMVQALTRLGHESALVGFAGNAASLEGGSLERHYGISTPFRFYLLRAFRMFKNYDLALRAFLRARRFGANLVYTRHLPTAFLCSIAGLPTYCELHSPRLGPVKKMLLRALVNSRNLRGLVTISKPLLSALREMVPRDKHHLFLVEPDGVDLEAFRAPVDQQRIRQELKIPDGAFLVGYVGHLYTGRGIELVLELAKLNPRMFFLLVGGEPGDVNRYRAAAGALGLENIVFLGFVPNSSVPGYMQACDALLMPYQRSVQVSGGGDTSAWMSPLKMFEYLAAGRAFVSSELPVLREILHEGVCLFCDPERPDEWNAAIRRLATDEALRGSLAARARTEAERYSWEARVTRILEFR